MPVKTLKSLAIAAALALPGVASADIICDWFHPDHIDPMPCPAGRTAAQTGDDAVFFQTRLNADADLAEDLMDYLDVDLDDIQNFGQTFAQDVANVESDIRRMVNAGILLDEVIGPNNEDWLEWVTDYSACFWFMNHCGDSGGLRGESNGIGGIALTPITVQRVSPVERASTMVHEAGHHFEDHDGDDICQNGASCDYSWTDDGPNRDQIEFMIDTKQQLNALPDPMWEEVRQAVNSRLNANFGVHPGFNLARPNSYYHGAYETVSFDVREASPEAAFFPDPDAQRQAIVGLGVTVADETVVRMRVVTQDMSETGVLVGPRRFNRVGRDRNGGLERDVQLPAGWYATGLAIRSTSEGVTHLGLRARRLNASAGSLFGEQTFWANNQATNVPETEFRVPSGEMLTAIGLNLDDEVMRFHSYRSMTPRGFTVGHGGLGGSQNLRACGSNQQAIGTLVATEGVGNAQSIGFFGLVCASRADIAAGINPADAAATVVHTGYFDEDRQQLFGASARSFAVYEAGNLGPADVQLRLCPAGQAVERMGVYADNLVRKISWMRCDGGSFVSVNVGPRRGGYTHLACDQDPDTDAPRNLVMNGIRGRSGWRLDRLQLHCTN